MRRLWSATYGRSLALSCSLTSPTMSGRRKMPSSRACLRLVSDCSKSASGAKRSPGFRLLSHWMTCAWLRWSSGEIF